MKTAFGVEGGGAGWGRNYVKKYDRPVRFQIINRARRDRTARVRAFVLGLNRSVRQLNTEVVRRTQCLCPKHKRTFAGMTSEW